MGLTPLDCCLPRTNRRHAGGRGGLLALALVTIGAWRVGALAGGVGDLGQRFRPAGACLRADAHGLQATADRYAHAPGVVLSMSAAALVGALGARRAPRGVRRGNGGRRVVGGGRPLAAAAWRDPSRSDARHRADRATTSRSTTSGRRWRAAGRAIAARARYQRAVDLNPSNTSARRNLDLLEAVRAEREGGERAAAGDLTGSRRRVPTRRLLDPARTQAQAGLGMALTALGRYDEAREHLEAARRLGNTEAEVASALGVILAQAATWRGARRPRGGLSCTARTWDWRSTSRRCC
ncbi:MAG: hypothetical protein R2712_30820 [Vicinamibacterales bacterium]